MPSSEVSPFANSGTNSPKALLYFFPSVLLHNSLRSFRILASCSVTLEQSHSLHLESVVKDSASLCKNICDIVLLKPTLET